MTDTDYIKKAVELADGWTWIDDIEINVHVNGSVHIFMQYEKDAMNQYWLDALAAQLVRQVDSPEDERWVGVEDIHAIVYFDDEQHRVTGPDRTMNTIKAIVDSGVLDAKARR